MASSAGDDPAGQCLTMPTGGLGAETIAKAFADGTDEVKDLLKNEAEIIIECRYCRNLYRSIPNFLSHKRQYCRTVCRNALASDILAKQVEEFGDQILNDKASPPQSTKKGAGQSRRNIAAMFQKKVQSTIIVPDEYNKIELHTLPNISRAIPQTSFFDGQQWIVKQNKNMAVKERLDTDDRSILIMPQDTNVSQRAGDMTLRRRKLVDVQEKEMTGRELIVLDYIPANIRHHINPASCTCNYEGCTTTKPFESLLSLAYHLTVKHNRPLTEKETVQMRRGREGMYLCFLCSTTHGTSEKLLSHLKKEHAEVLAAHEDYRSKQRSEMPVRSRRRAEAQRSMSPEFNNDSLSGDEDNEEELPIEDPVEEVRHRTPPPSTSKPKSRVGSAKKSAAKNTPPARTLPKRTPKRRRLDYGETISSSSSQNMPKLVEMEPDSSSQKSSTPTVNTLAEVARRLSSKNPPSSTTSESPEPSAAPAVVVKEEPISGITEGIGDEEPPATPQPKRKRREKSNSRLTDTRSPSADGDLAIRRSQRTHRRRPLHFDEYATTEREFRAVSTTAATKGATKRQRVETPPTAAPKALLSLRREPYEASDDESSQDIKPFEGAPPHRAPVPTATAANAPVLPKMEIPVSSAIAKTRQALTASIRKARTTAPNTPSKARYGGAGVDDLEAWVMPTEDSNSGTESVPFTPRAQEAREVVTKGSSRRKQRMDISDDGNNDLTVISSPEDDDDQPNRPEDLAALPIILTPADETIFFQALKPRFKEGSDGNHQCSECGNVLLSQADGRKHMMNHVRAVRFRCALCDSGAFYIEAMRDHLINRHCPGLHMASQFCSLGVPCMTPRNADGLTKIVCPEQPGKFMFTSGKIVTTDNPKPHRPDPKAEENILGPSLPPRLSPSKSLGILNHRSPMKNFGTHVFQPTHQPAFSTATDNASTSRPSITLKPTVSSGRSVTPLKIVARKPTSDEPSSSRATFTILKRPQVTAAPSSEVKPPPPPPAVAPVAPTSAPVVTSAQN
uniref:C2H2-type domain-containing protein n=1 Tax=Panagrellus redivivus TaxID=6233 RepID=A0A7E4VFI4_PANRE